MKKNIQIIDLTNGSEKTTKIEIDNVSMEIASYFLKDIIDNFIKNNGDIEKVSEKYSGFDWTCDESCDMCVCDKNQRSETDEK